MRIEKAALLTSQAKRKMGVAVPPPFESYSFVAVARLIAHSSGFETQLWFLSVNSRPTSTRSAQPTVQPVAGIVLRKIRQVRLLSSAL